ncbi:hypothetical protein ACMHYQ_12130 [Ectopseudomonas guguanensis]|uniref:hypothetical protein n=1 Tax=Ectopseudomonas guguanensis TaxID=1198456 RepID=UPI0039C47C99
MEGFSLFKRHINEIHKAASILIEKQQKTMPHWPELFMTDQGDERFKLEFHQPAIIWNAPLRGSSTSSTKRAIVMGGYFCIKDDIFISGSAFLEVYEIVRPEAKCQLSLLEAMHFDIEPNALHQSPFHPMFHVQFGTNNHWDVNTLKNRVAEIMRIEVDQIEIDRSKVMPTRDVRIPTPQMDYLSMLVMVVADYFCDKKAGHEVKKSFKNLIHKVMNSKNIARTGKQSRELEGRWTEPDKPFSAGHWYQESCK